MISEKSPAQADFVFKSGAERPREAEYDTPFGGVTHKFELPPVVPIDANAKDVIQPLVNHWVEENTKAINDKIIENIEKDNTEKKKIRRL